MKFILTFIIIILTLYSIIGWKKIFEKYRMFLDKTYWTDYNTIEFAAWFTKALIIIPGLVFGIEIWYMHFLTLITSA